MFRVLLILFFSILLLFSCSKKNNEVVITEPAPEEKAVEIYSIAVEALKEGDAFFAGKKFREVENLFPQGKWAAKASLMASYSDYSRNA